MRRNAGVATALATVVLAVVAASQFWGRKEPGAADGSVAADQRETRDRQNEGGGLSGARDPSLSNASARLSGNTQIGVETVSAAKSNADASSIPARVKKIFQDHLGVDASIVTRSASIIDDLGADSLDTVELVMAFEEEFGIEIPDDAAERILTVGDAIDFVAKND